VGIPERWTDQIEEVGTVRRIYFRILVDYDNTRTWHYFGTTQVEKPPHGDYDAVEEHPYIQLPQDLQHLPKHEADRELYNLGLECGLNKESIDT
jgi:hypothetical protein